MNKKLLTINDLVVFCREHNFTKFDSSESGYRLSVVMPCEYYSLKEKDKHTLFGKVKIFHTGRNRNNSNVTYEAAKKALPNIKYKPVLANFCEINGIADFTSHDLTVDDEGNIQYKEKQVGCFTADEPVMEYDEENDRYYVYANVAIPREYTDAAAIIERKKGTKVSAELFINSMTYNNENNELILEDIELTGLTLLGKNPITGKDVDGGMEGARMDIIDFSENNNKTCFDSNEKLVEVLEKINKTIFSITERKEGGIDLGKDNDKEKSDTEIFTEKEKSNSDEENKITYSFNGKNFAVSLDKIQSAIHTLVNTTYGLDGTYYSTIVYPDNVVMIDAYTDKTYRQNYREENGSYSLIGERVEVEANWLTKEESLKLDNMINNFSDISEKLSRYETEPMKEEILNSSDYKQIYDTDEFKELRKEENHFNLSVEEIKEKADNILLAYAKKGTLTFAGTENNTNDLSKKFIFNSAPESRYGDLFNYSK